LSLNLTRLGPKFPSWLLTEIRIEPKKSSCHKQLIKGNRRCKKEANMKFQIPNSIKTEHEILHRELLGAIESGGETADAASVVAAHLHLHFESEEKFALPPLALLRPLAEGTVTIDMEEVISRADQLKANLPKMLQEHTTILAALDQLQVAATRERKPRFVEFANKLKLHAQNEEEVLYPAAILVGEFVRTKLREQQPEAIVARRSNAGK
jgi:hypothetical protein